MSFWISLSQIRTNPKQQKRRSDRLKMIDVNLVSIILFYIIIVILIILFRKKLTISYYISFLYKTKIGLKTMEAVEGKIKLPTIINSSLKSFKDKVLGS